MLVAQLDYIYFSFGLVLFLLGAVCVSISRTGPLPTSWWLLGVFAFTLGVGEWLEVLALGGRDSETFHTVRVLVLAAAFAMLLEFARRTTRLLTGKTAGPWIFWPGAAVLAAVAVATGNRGLETAVRLVFGAPAAFWTAGIFFLAAHRTRDLGGSDDSRRARAWAGVSFVLFGVAVGLVVPPAPFLPGAWPSPERVLDMTGLPMALVRAIPIGGMALAIWALAVSFDARGSTLRKRRVLFWVMAAAIAALLAGGWIFTDRLGRIHEADTIADAEATAAAAYDHLVRTMRDAERSARTLAALVGRYDRGRPAGDVGELEVLADAVAAGLPGVTAYVMGPDGTTLASSNRGTPTSLVGRNFRDRPYFQAAARGEPGHFAGVGLVTGTPGYYASVPVRGPAGEVVAVAVVKQDLAPALVDPGGSRQVTIAAANGATVVTTRSAEGGEPAPLPPVRHGSTWLTVDGRRNVAVSRELPGTEWALVVLRPEKSQVTNRLLGIVTTLLLCGVVLAFFVAMQRQLGAEARIATKRREAEGRARDLARRVDTDALTGALNRQGFNEAMAREVSRSRRHRQPLALVMVDLDDFKRVNDAFGHAAGDQVLVRTANLLRSCVRESDVVARWGGEEFVVIAPMTGEAGGVSLAEKLRAIMAATHLGPREVLTASFGVAELADEDTIDALVARADRALYRAKNSGRNRVCGTGGGPAGPPPAARDEQRKGGVAEPPDRMYADTGFGPIDVEHAALSRALWALVQDVNAGNVDAAAASLEDVLRGVEGHFGHEEALMARYDYPQRMRHAEAHASFVADVRKSMQELREKGISPWFRRWVVSRLSDWFRFHILAHDTSLARFLLEVGALDGSADLHEASGDVPGPGPGRR